MSRLHLDSDNEAREHMNKRASTMPTVGSKYSSKKITSNNSSNKTSKEKTVEKTVNNDKYSSSRLPSIGHANNFFGAIIVFLIGVIILRFLYTDGSDIITFSDLLTTLQEAPNISSKFRDFIPLNPFTEEWPVFEVLRPVLNALLSCLSIFIWLFGSLLDVIGFIIYFIRWVFI